MLAFTVKSISNLRHHCLDRNQYVHGYGVFYKKTRESHLSPRNNHSAG